MGRDDTAGHELVAERLARLLRDHPPESTPSTEFLEAQFDAGLAAVDFPAGAGGLGVSPALQEVVVRALYDAGAPSAYYRNPIGVGHAAPTIVAHGRADQLTRFLRPLFAARDIWCQLFSEPDAGSDLASLSTRAERDGDEWVVNGVKCWTSLARVSRWAMLLARTDPNVPKHRGLTYFVLDMTADGVDVRPLRQMTGDAEFNEVFLRDVRVPDADRVGGTGHGWRVATSTLMSERVAVGGVPAPRGAGLIGEAVEAFGGLADGSPVRRDRLMRAWSEAEVHRLNSMRSRANRDAGGPGPEGAIAKLMYTRVSMATYGLMLDMAGPEGLLYSSYDRGWAGTDGLSTLAAAGIPPVGFELTSGAGPGSDGLDRRYLRSRANSIEAGTSEIMRGVVAENVLGLPREPRLDLEVPWSQVPRSAG